MTLATYSDLKSAVADWLDRADLTARIPDFITLAEAQMSRVLRVSQMIRRTTASIDSEFTEVPNDFLKVVAFSLADGTELKPTTHAQITTAKASNAQAGKPLFFARVGEAFQLCPPPDQPYSVALTYYAAPAPLSGTNTSNWLLAEAPDAYLYGALLQAAPYLSDEARVPLWAQLHQAALASLKAADDVPTGALRVEDGLRAAGAYNINRDL